MKTGCLIGLVAETPIHAGIGKATDALDLPVAREAITEFPHIPGSGTKGALRVWAGENGMQEAKADCLFGKASGDDGTRGNAGAILCGEARLALLPVRCTTDAYKFVTCPLIISRLQRDLERAGFSKTHPAFAANLASGQYLGQPAGNGDRPLGLEEREFGRSGDLPAGLVEMLLPLVNGVFDQTTLENRLVVLTDEDFKWFARFGLPITTRNKLDENKIVANGALWSEEALAPDTVMWMLLAERVAGELEPVRNTIGGENGRYIQMGGNETIGQGWFSMRDYISSATIGGGDDKKA